MIEAKGFSALVIVTALVFMSISVGLASAQQARPIVSIRADGTIDPASAPIQRNGNTYVFTGDIYAEIRIERSGITIDGAGHTIMGPYNGSQTLWIIGEGPNQTPTGDTELWSIGIDTVTNAISDLTIENLNIKNFSIGIYVWTQHNLVTKNAFSNCIVGILLAGNNNTIVQNYIANNKNGIYFGSNQPGNIPLGIALNDNDFVDNLRQLSGCVCIDYNTTEQIHTWDNGARGNYWSDYRSKYPNATEAGNTGVGNIPYTIDPLNIDRFPLIQPVTILPSPAATASTTPTTPAQTPTPNQLTNETWLIVAIIATLIVIIITIILVTRRGKTP